MTNVVNLRQYNEDSKRRVAEIIAMTYWMAKYGVMPMASVALLHEARDGDGVVREVLNRKLAAIGIPPLTDAGAYEADINTRAVKLKLLLASAPGGDLFTLVDLEKSIDVMSGETIASLDAPINLVWSLDEIEEFLESIEEQRP
jgi:hypothetical protein